MTSISPNYERAREILGGDFISLEEVVEARMGITYTAEQLTRIAETIPSREVIEWCCSNGYMLIPNPPKEMSFCDLYGLRDGPLRPVEMYPSMKTDKTQAGSWLALRKDIVPGSTNMKALAQLSLLSKDEYIPNVSVLVWGVGTYRLVRDRLPGNRMDMVIYARTSSRGPNGVYIAVGCNHIEDTISADNVWTTTHPYPMLGVASALKL